MQGLDRQALARELARHGYDDLLDADGERIDGFLRGFIDLVVEHEGRWYVLDYKSNWLGSEPGHYAGARLDAAMRAHDYRLQYLLYLLALHRHLGTRLGDYDWDRHVGGAFYLFMRGMDPARGMECGVFFDRPDAACMHALDACFREGAP